MIIKIFCKCNYYTSKHTEGRREGKEDEPTLRAKRDGKHISTPNTAIVLPIASKLPILVKLEGDTQTTVFCLDRIRDGWRHFLKFVVQIENG